jgi:hypothetical protein
LKRIFKDLSDREDPAPKVPKPTKSSRGKKVFAANIAQLNETGFHINLMQKETEFFTTSLYKIDRIIEEKANPAQEDSETEEELLARTVPLEYHDLIKVFSKKESDKLPPHRQYDHKIQLEKEVPLGYHPLYHMTLEELQTLKEYL